MTRWPVRAACLLAGVAYAAGPLWLALTSPAVPAWLRVALAGLTVLATVRPRWSPAVLLALVPLLPVWPTLYLDLPPALVHLVVLTQAVPWLIRRGLSGEQTSSCAFTPGWALFVVVAAVSVAVQLTPDRWRSAELNELWRNLAAQVPAYIFVSHATSDGRAVPMLVALADGLWCCLIVSGALGRPTRLGALQAGAIGACATAGFGMLQASSGLGLQTAWRTFDAGIVRINSTYVDPNALAAYYVLMGPIALGLAMWKAGLGRLLWGLVFAATSVAMVMTAGRTGLLSLVLACGVLAWLGVRRGLDTVDTMAVVRRGLRPGLRWSAALAAAVLALLVVAGSALNIRHAQQTSYLHTWLYTFNVRQPPDAIAKGRLAVWQTVLVMIGEAPMTGLGLGQSVNEFERYRDRLGIESLPADARLSAHNTYLLVASELGLLGLAAWIVMMLCAAYGIGAPGNMPARDPLTWPVIGLVAGLAGYAFTMITGDRILLSEDIVIGTTCAAMASLGSGPLPRPWRRAYLAFLLLILASWPLRAVFTSPDDIRLPSPEGLHAVQVGVRGDTYRWSTGYPVIYVPADTTRVRIPLRNLSAGPQRADVFINNRPADSRTLPPGHWITLEYRLPAVPGRRWHRIALRISPTWRAPGDPRILGVVVGEWTVE